MRRPAAAALALLLALLATPARGQPMPPTGADERMARLERQVQELQAQAQEARDSISEGLAGFSLIVLYMFFCGLWAANTGRSFWLWWSLGVFNVFTLAALLVLADRDWKTRPAPPIEERFD